MSENRVPEPVFFSNIQENESEVCLLKSVDSNQLKSPDGRSQTLLNPRNDWRYITHINGFFKHLINFFKCTSFPIVDSALRDSSSPSFSTIPLTFCPPTVLFKNPSLVLFPS